MRNQCRYGESSTLGVSCRDEEFTEAFTILSNAWRQGFVYFIVDDSFMLFKEQIEGAQRVNLSTLAQTMKDYWWK